MTGLLRAAPISTDRFTLEPLDVHHAAEMVKVLAGTAIYKYIGGQAPTAQELQKRYAAQAPGVSPDGREAWLNWIIREQGRSIGFVQASVEAGGATAVVAWVVGEAFQGRGAATEASHALVSWLRHRVPSVRITAFIHPENIASASVARHLGLTPTGRLNADGEAQWEDPTPAV